MYPNRTGSIREKGANLSFRYFLSLVARSFQSHQSRAQVFGYRTQHDTRTGPGTDMSHHRLRQGKHGDGTGNQRGKDVADAGGADGPGYLDVVWLVAVLVGARGARGA